MCLLLLCLGLFLAPFPAIASSHSTESLWTGVFSRKTWSESVDIHQEFQFRYNFDQSLTNQAVFRVGPLWHWSETLELGLLYAFLKTGLATEHRLTQQATYRINPLWSVRLRVEERTLEKTDGMAIRVRLQNKLQIEWHPSQSLLLAHEIFYHLHQPGWLYNDVFDRNRFFIGNHSQFEKISFDYGYMNQHVNQLGSDLNEHIFIVYLNI
jgi:hypothetical protein